MSAEEPVEYNYVLTQPDSESGEITNGIKKEAELDHETENTNALSSKINNKGDSAVICNDDATQKDEGNPEENMTTNNKDQAESGDDGHSQEDSAETSDYNVDNDTETDDNYDYQNLLHSKQDNNLVSDEDSSIPNRHSAKLGNKVTELNAKTNVSKLGTVKVKSELDMDTNTIVLNRNSQFKTRSKLDPSQMRYFCDRCDEGFKFPYQLTRHVEVKHEGKYPYSCNICGKSFDRISSQRDHMLVHTDLRPFECKVCKKKFKMNGNLRKHMRDIHTADAGPKLQFQCEYCSKIFPTKERLLSHFIVHDTEKAFECNICGKKFNRKNNLKEHLITHSSEKNYKCPDCHMCFNRPYSLKIHARNHLAVKPYKCDLCPSSFSQLHALKTHFRLHTGEKPFKCSICQRSFRQQATLQVHFKRHTGVKDWVCKVCGRGFVIKRRLIEHERMHTGEKPFSCDLCPYTAATSSGMRFHKKTHLRQIARQALKQVEQLEHANAGTENNTGDQVSLDNLASLTSTTAGRGSKQKNTNRHNKIKKVRLSNENKAPKLNVSTRFLRKKKVDVTKLVEKDIESSENDNEDIDDDLSVEEGDNSMSVDDDIGAKSNGTFDSMIEIVNDHVHLDKLDNPEGKLDSSSGDDNAAEEVAHHTNNSCMIEKTDVKKAAKTKAPEDDGGKLVELNQEQSFVIEETGLNLQTVGSKPRRGGSRKRKAKLNNIDESSMREILYKHLNEFIPVIDGDLLAEKIDLITQEFMDHFQQQNTPAKEIVNMQKVLKAKRPSKKTGGKSVNSSLNQSNSDLTVESGPFVNSQPEAAIIPTSQVVNTQTIVSTFSRTPNVNIPHTGTTSTMYDDNALTRSTSASNSLLICALMAANNKGLFTHSSPTVTTSSSLPQSASPSTVICSPPIVIKKEPGMDNTNPEKSFFSNKLRDMLQSKPLDLPITNSFNIASPANGSVLQHTVQTAQKSGVSNSSSQKSSAVLRSMLSTPPKHYLLATKNSFNTSLVTRQLQENHRVRSNGSRRRAKASDFPWLEEPHQEPEPQNPAWVSPPTIPAVYSAPTESTFNITNIKAEPKSP